MINNLKSWKTTLVGIVLIGIAIAYLFVKDEINVTIFIINLILGIGLLFTPDSILDGLKSFIKSNKDKKI